jgi:PKHD-type hydroxylase
LVPFYLRSAAFSSDWCDAVIERAKKLPLESALIADAVAKETLDQIRKTKMVRFDPLGREQDIIHDIAPRVARANMVYSYDLTVIDTLHYLEYSGEENSFYRWHSDAGYAPPYCCRKLSIIIQLSDPSDYEGGTFEFFTVDSPGADFLARGSLLIFPSHHVHQVQPVVKGTRSSLVGWAQGPAWR